MIKKRLILFSTLAIIILVGIVSGLYFYENSAIEKQNQSIEEKLEENSFNDVEESVLSISQNFENYIVSLEGQINRSMQNAAEMARELDAVARVKSANLSETDADIRGELTDADVKRIAEETGMTDIMITDKEGYFTQSIDKTSIGVNLFEIWEGYRWLVTGEADVLHSPLKVRAETGEIFKIVAFPMTSPI